MAMTRPLRAFDGSVDKNSSAALRLPCSSRSRRSSSAWWAPTQSARKAAARSAHQSAWRSRHSVRSDAFASRSRPYPATKSSSRYLSDPSSTWVAVTTDLSTSEPIRSRISSASRPSPEQTATAPARSQPPVNTDIRHHSACSCAAALVEAPVHAGAQGPVPVGCVPIAAVQEAVPVRQLIEHPLRGQGPDPRGGQLHGERHSLHGRAQLGDRLGVLRASVGSRHARGRPGRRRVRPPRPPPGRRGWWARPGPGRPAAAPARPPRH